MSSNHSPIYVTERDAHTHWTEVWVDSRAGLTLGGIQKAVRNPGSTLTDLPPLVRTFST